jgi:hypothetical protein
VFLDDDAVPDPGWLPALGDPMGDPTVGITCVGSNGVEPDGTLIEPMPPETLEAPFAGSLASYRAGTFAVRADIYHHVGGYLAGLGTNHQYELFLRLEQEALSRGLRVVSNVECLLNIERRPVDLRNRSNPWVIYEATSWIIARHPREFGAAPEGLAAFEGVRGAAAARTGDWDDARRHFWSAARLVPRRARHWHRWAITFVPLLRYRTWHRKHSMSWTPDRAGLLVQRPDGPAPAARELFLAWDYEENPPTTDAPQVPAAPPRRIRWVTSRLQRKLPGLVVQRSDPLEVAEDPVDVLQRTARAAGRGPVLFVVSTSESSPIGPPEDRGRRREWSHEQFRLLLRSTGFRTERCWHSGGWHALLARNVATPTPTSPPRSTPPEPHLARLADTR